jgi:hypothetical protein
MRCTKCGSSFMVYPGAASAAPDPAADAGSAANKRTLQRPCRRRLSPAIPRPAWTHTPTCPLPARRHVPLFSLLWRPSPFHQSPLRRSRGRAPYQPPRLPTCQSRRRPPITKWISRRLARRRTRLPQSRARRRLRPRYPLTTRRSICLRPAAQRAPRSRLLARQSQRPSRSPHRPSLARERRLPPASSRRLPPASSRHARTTLTYRRQHPVARSRGRPHKTLQTPPSPRRRVRRPLKLHPLRRVRRATSSTSISRRYERLPLRPSCGEGSLSTACATTVAVVGCP